MILRVVTLILVNPILVKKHLNLSETIVNEPKVVSQPKVWSNAPIIEEYESDSDDNCVTTTSKEQEQPSFAFINTVKHVKTPRQTVKEQNTCSQSPKPDKKDCSGLMSKKLGLGYGFTKKACFAKCGTIVQSVNHQNQFVPTAILTRTGRIQVNTARASSANNVNTARHNFNSQAVLTNAARKDYPQRALKNKWIVDSGCFRHMTGNKAYLAEYQYYNGGTVAFGGSKGYITGKDVTRRTRPVDQRNQQSRHVGSPKKLIIVQSTIQISEAKNEGKKPNKNTDLKTNEKPVDQEDQVFLDELERLKRQEKEANDAAETIRKEFPKILRICFFKQELLELAVTPKTSHLHAVKRIFRYLKGKPKLGLWYPRVSSFDLEAYSDSDYAGANLDRKSTTGGCQFLGRRLISWQCKKQTIVATSTTEAEYVAAANCCGQVLWIQNQMLDYGFNFMNTKIYIDNESTICIVKNPVFHSKTKHIEIRHHFIRDAYEKKLIQVLKIHTDDNVADLLTKAFDVSRFNFLIVNIGMINL
ncbi:hypothetical protein Tco_0586942 [Tanacetum coccineum]